MAALPDIKTRILTILNNKNGTNLTPDQLVFGPPQPNADPINNTSVLLSYNTGAGNYWGQATITYGRNDLTDWIKVQPDALTYDLGAGVIAALASSMGISTIAELLIVLNTTYNGGFTLEDFADGPLPDISENPEIDLPALPTSYQYTGTLKVLLFDPSQLVALNDLFHDVSLGTLPMDPTASDPGTVSSSGSVA